MIYFSADLICTCMYIRGDNSGNLGEKKNISWGEKNNVELMNLKKLICSLCHGLLWNSPNKRKEQGI